jgi:micrococcal nuclease
VGIADGDTLTVLNHNQQEVKIRLAEIDAPEKRQAFGTRSK